MARRLPLLLCLAVFVVAAPVARADGDPASDYLITQPAFFPFESKASEVAQTELTDLLADAKKQGLELRVALIATRTDLGAVPVLYGKPQRYANFLGQEIVYYYKGPLLVVMPGGYGLYKNGEAAREDKKVLAALAPPGSTDGNALVVGAENAVRALARRRGLTLRQAPVESSSGSGNRDRLLIVAGVILLCAFVAGLRLLQRRRKGASDPA